MPVGGLTVVLGNDRGDIPQVAGAVERLMARTGVGRRAGYAVSLAVDELLTNVVSYGYLEGAPGRIEVAVVVGESQVTLTLVDDGRPHDPFSTPPPPLTEQLETRPVGGLGIHLVREVMDEVRYRREGDRNIVTCVVLRDPDETE